MLLNHTILQLRTTGAAAQARPRIGPSGLFAMAGQFARFCQLPSRGHARLCRRKTLSARIPGAGGVLRAIGGKHAQSRAAADFDLAVQTTARRRQKGGARLCDPALNMN